MAKRGILEHPKTIELAELLELPECFAVGVLECLWHHVARYFPHGEVTGLKPSVLARGIRYPGDGQALWDALLETGFLDEQPNGVILVHDWSEHADNSVHQLLKKREEQFADGHAPFTRARVREMNRSEEDTDRSQTVHEPFTNHSRLPEPKPEPKPILASQPTAPAHEQAREAEPLDPVAEALPVTPELEARRFYHDRQAWFEEVLGQRTVTQLEALWDKLAWYQARSRSPTNDELDLMADRAREFMSRPGGIVTVGVFLTALDQVMEGGPTNGSRSKTNNSARRPGQDRRADGGGRGPTEAEQREWAELEAAWALRDEQLAAEAGET